MQAFLHGTPIPFMMPTCALLCSSLTTGYSLHFSVDSCGFLQDTRPWRLHFPVPVHWFDVDQPQVVTLKQQLLSAAEAQLTADNTNSIAPASASNSNSSASVDMASTSTSSKDPSAGTSSSGTAAVTQDQQQSTHVSHAAASSGHPPQFKFPLTAASWRAVGADLSCISLEDALTSAGFVKGQTTVWIAEALLYYLPLPKVSLCWGVLLVCCSRRHI